MIVHYMTIVCGWRRDTFVERGVIDLGCGVGEIACLECGGSGDWTQFYPEPETLDEPLQCVQCKGTGKQYVNL